jgi:hypothetical protein
VIRSALVTLLLITLGHPTDGSAQAVVDISGTPTCRGCRLDFTRVAILGSVDGEGALAGDPNSFAQDSRGNYYVTQFKQPDHILQFNRAGDFVRKIGRAGSGPGEYRYIVSMTVGPGDSVYVFDLGNARLTVLSPTHEVARTAPIVGQFFSAIITKAGMIANAHLASREQLGQPLRTLRMDGAVQAVYGASKPSFRPDVVYSVMRSIAGARDSTVWSGYKTRYAIEEWSVHGKLLRTLTRTVPWFPPYEKRARASATQPLEPWLIALRVDRTGLLWSAITVPEADWSKRWTELGFTEDKGVDPDQRIVDTVIEVLDVERKVVVFSQRLPHYVYGFLNDSTAFGYSVDAQEIPHIEIWRSRLIGR